MTVVTESVVDESASIVEFWHAKAELSHEWFMLMFQFRKDADQRRRCVGRWSDEYWQHLAELDRAQAIFYAQYLIASAAKELAREGMSLDYVFAMPLLYGVDIENLL